MLKNLFIKIFAANGCWWTRTVINNRTQQTINRTLLIEHSTTQHRTINRLLLIEHVLLETKLFLSQASELQPRHLSIAVPWLVLKSNLHFVGQNLVAHVLRNRKDANQRTMASCKLSFAQSVVCSQINFLSTARIKDNAANASTVTMFLRIVLKKGMSQSDDSNKKRLLTPTY